MTDPVRDGLIDVMTAITSVLELCLFKMDVPLATELQERLANLPATSTPTDDWRETLAGL